jgi:UDP-N-acetyl-D-mannosaminuronic acid transferase (WecB/TagA/CpsF family)
MIRKKTNNIRILGIDFFNGTAQQALNEIANGGYMVVPAAPALVALSCDPQFANALVKSDLAIADSRYMALLWLLLRRQKVSRISGLTFLNEFFKLPDLKKPGTLFLVDPSEHEALANQRYLKSIGIDLPAGFSYVAPFYGDFVEDEALVVKVERLMPRYVLVNIGGGTQEKLALYLRENLSYHPAILCTGAAIAFLSGKQAPIPAWVDHVGLGWLWRCLDNPGRFVPRYLSAFRLFKLMYKYGPNRPPLSRTSA